MKRLFFVFLLLLLSCVSVPVSPQNLSVMCRQISNQQTAVDSLRHVLKELERNLDEDRQRQVVFSERIQDRVRQDYGYYVQHVSWVMGLYGVGVALLVAIVGFLVPFMYNKMLRNDLKKCRKQAISAAGQVRQASIRMSGLERQIAALQNQLEEMKSIRNTVEKIQEKIEISEKATYAAARKAEISKLFAEAYNEKDHKKQIELYTKLINLNPNLAAAYYNRSYVYDEIGEYSEALVDINKAIELNPENAGFYCNRGIVYGHLGDMQAELADYNKAIELNSKHVGAYCNRGNLYDDIGEVEKALNDLNMALALDPNHATSYNNRANVYLYQNEIEQAMADIQKAFELEKENADQYDTRGCIYLEMKEYDPAIRDFTKAIELNPKKQEFYENRARAYRELAGIETEEEKKRTYRKAEDADRAMARKLGDKVA